MAVAVEACHSSDVEIAITYHRRLRSKAQVTSMLELIPGIGRERARVMLRTLGSVQAVRDASDDDLLAIRGITPRQLQLIREFFETRGRVSLEDEREDD